MRNRQLHAALAAFAEEAAWQLAAQAQEGAEVDFEVVEASGSTRDTPLYCYRPLTSDFIRERLGLLGRLPSYLPAVHALSATGGLDTYIAARSGEDDERPPPGARARAEVALRLFLTRVFADSTDFELETARLDRAIGEILQRTRENRELVEVVVPILGIRLLGGEIVMGDGLSLVRGDLLEEIPSEAAWPRGGDHPHTVAVLEWETAPGDPSPLAEARARLRRALSALRLYTEVPIAASPAAWVRTGDGAWRGVPSGLPPRPPVPADLEPCVVAPDHEDELRAFCSLIARRTPRSGPLAWALGRFELACWQPDVHQALTDHLLALRALLEPDGDRGDLLAGRIAALCAERTQRDELRARIAETIALERAAIAGVAPDAETIDPMVAALAGHLRAILRDLLCGHLDPDVRALADRLLEEDQPTLA
jgi:hypothetical protein